MSTPAEIEAAKEARHQRRVELADERYEALEQADPVEQCRHTIRAAVSGPVMLKLVDNVGIHRIKGEGRPYLAAMHATMAHVYAFSAHGVSKARRGPTKPGVSINPDDVRMTDLLLGIAPSVDVVGGVGAGARAAKKKKTTKEAAAGGDSDDEKESPAAAAAAGDADMQE